MISPEFLVTSAVVVLTPGAGVLYTVSTGLSQGRAAPPHAPGGWPPGRRPPQQATALGLAAVMHAGALAFQLLKLAGVAYLLYLAWATWRDRTAFTADAGRHRQTAWPLIGRGVLVNLLNPKLTLFFLAFLPQFMNPADPAPMRHFAVLSAVFMAMTLGVFVVYGALAHALRERVIGSLRVQNALRRGFAAAFALMAARLAASDR
jgi:threonine/homoserine/homoserine lactone efflux protein